MSQENIDISQEAIDNMENDQAGENLEYESFSEEIDEPEAEHSDNTTSNDEIIALKEEVAATKDQLIRALAEAENTRKRAQKDREDASKFAVSSFARDLLSVADNLRRALDAIPQELTEQNENIKNLTNGIEATERELLRGFEKNGIQKLEPLDQPFNPNFHEVMFEAPMPDKPNATVIQILEPGYTLNGRILRPARVGISKGGEAPATQDSAEPGQNINTEA